jgi:hypothetical protein
MLGLQRRIALPVAFAQERDNHGAGDTGTQHSGTNWGPECCRRWGCADGDVVLLGWTRYGIAQDECKGE